MRLVILGLIGVAEPHLRWVLPSTWRTTTERGRIGHWLWGTKVHPRF